MGVLRTRRFQAGDEGALNDGFLEFLRRRSPGATRSLEHMRFVWLGGPGGAVESWLVEEQGPDGSWRVVGHHGLCPLRFTLGSANLLCAKTINTFLLPEIRSRFLYVRFEQQCLEDACSRYDVMYTCGPGTSRLRKPLGYAAGDVWVHFEHGSRYLDFTTRAFSRLMQTCPSRPSTAIARGWARACARTVRKPPFEFVEYTPEQAAGSVFFEEFWEQARGEAGMSPRRDIADLAWRFWTRPGVRFVTLVHSWAGGARAYAIVNTANPYQYQLADFFVTPMRADLLDALLDSLFAWCARRGALTMSVWTTATGQPPPLMDVLTRRMGAPPLKRFRRRSEFSYRVSPRTAGLPIARWNTTEFLLV